MASYLIIDMLSKLREILWEWGPWVYNKSMNILDIVPTIYRAVYKELYGTKGWLFLKDSKIPISEEMFETNEIQPHHIKWITTTEPPTFRNPKSPDSEETYKHISYLGFSIIIPGVKTIDLTDWINEIKWSGVVQPSPSEIFSLWCCKHKSHLMFSSNSLIVEIITDNGDVIKRGLNDLTQTTMYENDGAAQTDRQDPNWHLDLVLSSGGR